MSEMGCEINFLILLLLLRAKRSGLKKVSPSIKYSSGKSVLKFHGEEYSIDNGIEAKSTQNIILGCIAINAVKHRPSRDHIGVKV